ncbi:kinase-associated lipoprotein B [Bacillus sp. PK3_68]|uniref:kinase-associated lipoprotein B n=1 Tax=Bacillus sp. PK3_68 TaxID=2027408 RepID=UPI000E732344|nr:kinase-associated lipoprotein B [Bacillus sp. PK3_68]RJS60177.1 kinase [Bacillus sp. PK3_68]
MIKTGDIVTAFYKTGKYIGEVSDSHPDSYTVKILAVLRHPAQGDLHHPKQVDVPFFHERKALAYTERANIPASTVKHYEGSIPDYNESLKEAVTALKSRLEQEDSEFSKKSLMSLQAVQREYELMYNIAWT